jgi:hypothetical protein
MNLAPMFFVKTRFVTNRGLWLDCYMGSFAVFHQRNHIFSLVLAIETS